MLIVLETIRRLYGQAAQSPILTFTVELLVLLLIAYELFSDRFHRRKIRRRSKRILCCFIAGTELKTTVPGRHAAEEDVILWRQRAGQWSAATNAQLAKYSAQSSAAFLRTHAHEAGQHFFYVANSAQMDYFTLREQLENLHAIIERPEVYF